MISYINLLIDNEEAHEVRPRIRGSNQVMPPPGHELGKPAGKSPRHLHMVPYSLPPETPAPSKREYVIENPKTSESQVISVKRKRATAGKKTKADPKRKTKKKTKPVVVEDSEEEAVESSQKGKRKRRHKTAEIEESDGDDLGSAQQLTKPRKKKRKVDTHMRTFRRKSIESVVAVEEEIEDDSATYTKSESGKLTDEILEVCRMGGHANKDLVCLARTMLINFLGIGQAQRQLVKWIYLRLKEATIYDPNVPLAYTGLVSFKHSRAELEALSKEEFADYKWWYAFGGQHGVK